MASASSSTTYLQQGYVPFSGNPAEFHGWASLFRSIMREAGLGNVTSGTEKAPEAPADSTETAAAAFEKDKLSFKEKNGNLYTRLYLATSDCPDEVSNTASQVVQSFASIWPEEVGDGRGAFLALESKWRVDGAFGVQELQDKLGSLAVSAWTTHLTLRARSNGCAEFPAS